MFRATRLALISIGIHQPVPLILVGIPVSEINFDEREWRKKMKLFPKPTTGHVFDTCRFIYYFPISFRGRPCWITVTGTVVLCVRARVCVYVVNAACIRKFRYYLMKFSLRFSTVSWAFAVGKRHANNIRETSVVKICFAISNSRKYMVRIALSS